MDCHSPKCFVQNVQIDDLQCYYVCVEPYNALLHNLFLVNKSKSLINMLFVGDLNGCATVLNDMVPHLHTLATSLAYLLDRNTKLSGLVYHNTFITR